LQCGKTAADILYSWCVTTVCDKEMSMRKCVKQPVTQWNSENSETANQGPGGHLS